MEYEKVNIEFEKIKPEEESKRLFMAVADKLHMDAPSDSHLKMVVKKTRKKFRGYCRIVSRIGVFVAEECSSNPEGTLAKIEKEMNRQLRRWKSERFDDLAQAS